MEVIVATVRRLDVWTSGRLDVWTSGRLDRGEGRPGMTWIERTAYPQFKRLASARVLHVFFTSRIDPLIERGPFCRPPEIRPGGVCFLPA
ncbi:hypothetical protein [Streptosporangium sp. NBC_01469]|uniref:hypothetical protein n=1 Tax=Streptosporangium sp. NBC_01469 TaxID=2903898 RepID=UPI002E2BAE11|nr:hypothetical protein [Streptosporangium sp. NBC_01469]